MEEEPEDKGVPAAHIDGEDPTAPAGPDECEVPVEEAEVREWERAGRSEESEYSQRDEFDDALPELEDVLPFADDGLPDGSVNPPTDRGQHPFHHDNQVCYEDDRLFVELFAEEWGQRSGKLDPWHPLSNHMQSNILVFTRSSFDAQGIRVPRFSVQPSRVVERFGFTVVGLSENEVAQLLVSAGRGDEAESFKAKDAVYLPVRPLRPRCRYYARQHFGNDDQMDVGAPLHNIFRLLCTHPARRSIGGAAMSLSGEAIYGCDLRDPPSPKDTLYMDRAFRARAHERPDLVRLPMFNLPGETVKLAPESSRPKVPPMDPKHGHEPELEPDPVPLSSLGEKEQES